MFYDKERKDKTILNLQMFILAIFIYVLIYNITSPCCEGFERKNEAKDIFFYFVE